MLGSQQWVRVAQDTTNPNQQTVMLPLSGGITLISIPLRTDSQLLSDLLPNLPDGSRAWTWDAIQQQFVEGFDQASAGLLRLVKKRPGAYVAKSDVQGTPGSPRVGVWTLRTLMSQEVIDGFEYVAD